MVFLSNERRTITGRLGPDKMASGLAQSGACRLIIHLRSELFINSVWVRASAGLKIFRNAVEMRSVGMYRFGCCQPDAGFSQAYTGKKRCALAFLHLRQPSSLLHLGKRNFG